MVNTPIREEITVLESDTAPADDREYEFSMTAGAITTGPAGTIPIGRRYHALPRHNDVLVEGVTDSNDELLARADELYVHSKYYDRSESGDDYFLDRHETWHSPDQSVFADEGEFSKACREHHLVTIGAEYTAQ